MKFFIIIVNKYVGFVGVYVDAVQIVIVNIGVGLFGIFIIFIEDIVSFICIVLKVDH